MKLETFSVPRPGARLCGLRYGSGPPLVLAHPLAFSKEWFHAETFGASFSVAAFDQRGHGETVAEGGLDPETMAEDVGAVMDACGWERAVVGGTSLGAATTLIFARRHPERVSTLVQDLPGFGPGTPRDPARSGRIAEALARSDLGEAARRITEGMSAGAASAWQAALRERWPADGGPRLAEAFRAAAAWRILDRWPEDLRDLRVPTLILALAGDPSHPLQVAETMQRWIPGARLVRRVPSLSPVAIARQWVEILKGERT